MIQISSLTMCSLIRSVVATGAVVLGSCAANPREPGPPGVGSLEGARVAIPTDDGKRELVFLAGSMEAAELAAFGVAAPNVRCVVPESPEEALRLAPEVHGADGRHCTPEFLAAAQQLVWVQSPSAGVAWLLEREGIRERDEIVVTNMQGVHGPAIAEHVFGMLLTLTRDIGYHQHPDRRGS